MKKILFKAAIDIPVLAVTALGLALTALSIGYFSPTGEQSKLQYNPDLWCVSNYLEQRPLETLKDGRARQDKLLDSKEDWIVREQVTAPSKEAAEAKVRFGAHGLFEPSEENALRSSLQSGDAGKAFFTTHYNTGATMAGPCWGTGSTATQTGSWLNQSINNQCGLGNPSQFEQVGESFKANLTSYSPDMAGNTCDAGPGGGSATADSSGSFKVVDGRIRWVGSGKTLDYIFAETTNNKPLARSDWNSKAVVIKGFKNDLPIEIHDTYAPGNHVGAPNQWLDLFSPCNEWSQVASELSSIKGSDGTYEAFIVDLKKPKPVVSATSKTLPDGTACPTTALPNAPVEGKDYRGEIALGFEKQYSILTNTNSGSGEAGSWNSQDNLGDGILNVPPIDESAYGLVGQCNRAAAGMAYLYRAGKAPYSGLGGWLKSFGGSTNEILQQVGTGVVDKRGVCASDDNWAEVRDQVLVKKNPVVLANSYGSSGHYITVVGFQGDEIIINDGSHFVGDGSGVQARRVSVAEMNQHLHHPTSGCRFLYAK